ncbi:MAG: hypothetical protein A2655_02175 [Candidatus Yanofskybacteria bacterium RIFCSPHIGHO2_01_FULL_43_42]|uniref:GH10 domain-containing protein n=1 Tax=Candidatus Yanofskybacteria bacterium RIFCSPLOWO2_01_FULL_43_22 TaxID=1802695 RepID=A0A1F8GHB3_9BACT|nr:MAG: hypothetical protein A2655_02175 [Candidatus Yanofskybacteria bacterium RIFCSPHIGHO2_01_FULL_43_42]OGN13275.1 MAG: hypothetical protein A3D48_03080 [Candidatus Yanofskybacteria bacterium RIFCSPHIGHO2_02_FULL_43_17]OGN24691.1 MAG: hypothetical protein A3A13_01305 [Candidatus Yanofskybacteria bacterium RIFCSPLOWO2_01_FULL_43_22]
MKKRNKIIIQILLIIVAVLWVFSLDFSENISEPIYGASFSRFHVDELGLNWKETYLALLNDLGIRNFRFSAHWPTTEPEKDKFNFSELDFQFEEAERMNASIVLAVGHRLPGWPECHTPKWVEGLSQEQHQQELLKYVETVVKRYKDSPSLKYWQIENEPFLISFSRAYCGIHNEKVNEILKKEIDLVRQLDSQHPIIITDSGEFGDWFRAYSRADVFGTSLYLYVWPKSIDFPIRYPITPGFFRLKYNITRLILGAKPTLVIELSAEPWLLQPIIETPIEVQLDRMGIDKFNEMIDFSAKSGFDGFYLWGAEWWYWLKLNGYPEHWERAKELFD